MHPSKNSTSPNAAFVTNTGEFINLFNSFFISDFTGLFVFILYLPLLSECFTSFVLEFILKYILLKAKIVITNGAI